MQGDAWLVEDSDRDTVKKELALASSIAVARIQRSEKPKEGHQQQVPSYINFGVFHPWLSRKHAWERAMATRKLVYLVICYDYVLVNENAPRSSRPHTCVQVAHVSSSCMNPE